MASQRTGKRPYHHGNLKDELLRAGLELVAQGGPEALSMRALSRRAGVSHAAPYRHFEDRRDLLAAIARQGFEHLDQRMADAATDGDGPLDRFRSIATAYVAFAFANPAHYGLMFGREVFNGPPPEDLRAAARTPLSRAVEAVAACQSAGAMPSEDPRVITDVAWATLHGLAVLATNGLVDAGPNEAPTGLKSRTGAAAKTAGVPPVVMQAVETLVRGLASDHPSRPAGPATGGSRTEPNAKEAQ